MAKKILTDLDATGRTITAGPVTTTGLTLSGTTSPITLNASVGTSGQVLTSAGPGLTPSWTTVSGGGSGFTGAGTSITGITATASTGTTTVTASSITFAGGSATTSSNALSDNATGGDLTIRAGGATFTGNSQGNATSGNLILDSGSVSSGALGNPVYGNIGIGTTVPSNGTTLPSGLAASVTISAAGTGFLNGASNATAQFVAGLVNIGTHSTSTVNIGSSDIWNGATTVNVISKSSSDSKTLNLATNGGTTAVKIATGASAPTIQLGVNSTSSATYLFGKNFIWQPTPAAVTSGATPITVANLQTWILTTTSTSGNIQLPTPANMDTITSVSTDIGFDWSLINTAGSGSVTVTANGSHTVVGNMVVTFGTSARFRSRRSAATPAWVTYRIS
jgi:hypothetical protein